MKKLITPLLITGCIFFTGMNGVAQNAGPESSPMKSTHKPGSAVSSVPAAPTLQQNNEQQTAKPIVPGGEFKPRDTRISPSAKSEADAYNTNSKILTPKPPAATAPAKTEVKKTEHVLQQQQ